MVNLFNIFINKTDKIYDFLGHYLIKALLIFHIVYFAILFGIVTIDIDYLNVLK